MNDIKTLPLPVIAALFGDPADIRRITSTQPESGRRLLVYASLTIAADEATHAMRGTVRKETWATMDRDGEQAPGHTEARAALHEYLLSRTPDVVVETLLKQIDMYFINFKQVNQGAEPPVVVLHLQSEAELAAVRRWVPDAVAIEVQSHHFDDMRASARPGWPEVDCVLGSLPPAPEWLPESDRRKEYRRQWALMMVDKIVEVARGAVRGQPF